MTHATPIPGTPLLVDLTGLPEPVILQIQQIVHLARERLAGADEESYRFLSRPRLTTEESRRLLDQMATRSSGHTLPTDFSRADLYDDHD